LKEPALDYPLFLGQVLYESFHNFARLKLERAIRVRGREKVGPFKDFGKAELVQGRDDGADGLLGADDEDFDGFSVRVLIAVKLEGEFEVNLPWISCGMFGGGEKRLSLHSTSLKLASIWMPKL
jgi:hypothetical protein